MLRIGQLLFSLIVLLVPSVSVAQVLLDSLFTVQNTRFLSLDSISNYIEVFSYDRNISGANGPHRTYVLDSNGVLISASTFENGNLSPRYDRKKFGSTYFTLIFNRTSQEIKYYKANNDSSLGTLTSQVSFNEPIDLFGLRVVDDTEWVLFGLIDSNYLQLGKRTYPFMLVFNPVLGNYRIIWQFERDGIPIPGARMYNLIKLSDNKRLLACTGCKRFWDGAMWRTSGDADLAVLDANYNFVVDTVPLFSSFVGYPFDITNHSGKVGPGRITGLLELGSGNIVFLGTVTDTGQVIINEEDMMLAKWSPDFVKLNQIRFGNPDFKDFHFQIPSLVQGWDGFIYSVSFYQNLFVTPQEVLVAKFDTSMNLLGTYSMTVPDKEVWCMDILPTRHGVYFIINYVDPSTGRTAYSSLYRIRNSGVGVGVKRGEQLVAARVYPNPVQELLYWEAEQETQRFVWYDMQGRKLREEQFTAAQRQELNTETLAPGIYLLQAFTPDGRNFAPQRVVVR